MNGPVTTVACPNGHASTNRAMCTVCGTPIMADGREAIDTTPTATAVPVTPPAQARAPGAARHLAAAPPIDPTEARNVAPVHSLAPFPTTPPLDHEQSPRGSDSVGTGPVGPATGGPPPQGAPGFGSVPPMPSMPSMPSVPPAAAYQPGPAVDPASRGMTIGSPLCPHCSAELHPGARFCEVCGYDPSTGSLPHVYAPVVRPAVIPGAAPPAGPNGPVSTSFGTPSGQVAAPPPVAPPLTGRWIATITADRAYYESHQVGDVPFPLGVPPRTIELPAGPISIGRRSRSRGTNPAIDLAGPPEDPAVSHTHASLLPSDDGAWKLIDHGSTNGTYYNESLDAVAANMPLSIAPGDRIYVGAWTRITLEIHPHRT